MKTFFATAALAAYTNAQAENITVPQLANVGQVAAGILYGISVDSNLDDLTYCMNGADGVKDDLEKALGELFHGDTQDAMAQIYDAIVSFPTVLDECKATIPDFVAMEQWISIVKDRDALKAMIEKNTARHIIKIKKDISELRSDLAAEQYFQAGEVIGELLTIELGDVPTIAYQTKNFGSKAIAEIVAGLVYGITEDNKLPEIQACIGETSEFGHEIAHEVTLLQGGLVEIIQAVHLGIKIIHEIPTELQNCEGMGDDFAAIDQWASGFTSLQDLAKHISKTAARHIIKVKRDVATIKEDWANDKYFKFGEDLADLLTLVVGPSNEAAFFSIMQ